MDSRLACQSVGEADALSAMLYQQRARVVVGRMAVSTNEDEVGGVVTPKLGAMGNVVGVEAERLATERIGAPGHGCSLVFTEW